MTDTKLADDGEVMFRQIHPSFVEDGRPSSQPFRPTPKDDNQLSVDRASLTTAQASFELFLTSGLESVAVYGVSVGEFSGEAIPCHSDPIEAAEGISANEAHAYADYAAHTESKQKIIAKRIKQKALARGQLHPPPGTNSSVGGTPDGNAE